MYSVGVGRVEGVVTPRGPPKWRLSNSDSTILPSIQSLFIHIIMPGIGPSLVFAAGLAVGVGAGSFIPKKSTKEIGVLPPPPVEKYDVVKRLPTATGSVVLQGGFPGTFPILLLLSLAIRVKRKSLYQAQHQISSRG